MKKRNDYPRNLTSPKLKNLAVLTKNYLAVLTKKKFGGFDLAVLTRVMSEAARADAVWLCFAFCNLDRFFILSPILIGNLYAV
jgi:alkylation response protein AidB-like acyl-CoA dehydrogenase